jgi:predicted NAD/FAD-dependent oxidoreductase
VLAALFFCSIVLPRPVSWASDADPLDPTPVSIFEGGEISWAARNSSKPGRSGSTWVVHAGAEWTRNRIDAPKDQIVAELTQIFAKQTGIDTTSISAQSAHRWLYSLVDNPLDVGALWDPELGLGLCGDWCHGARIEGAFLSGQAVAGRILGHLSNDSASGIASADLARAIAAG